MAFLKSDFDQRLVEAVSSRTAAATAFRAGDPRLLAQMDAAAGMLAMLSQQIDLAEVEPFIKARDGSILADASLKGVLPLAKPARVVLQATNTGASFVPLLVGRSIVDSRGRRFVLETSASIVPLSFVGPLPDDEGKVTAVQMVTREQVHTVSGSRPFYEIQMAPSPEDLKLVGIEVSSPAGAYIYTPDFANITPGARIYHVETDEYKRVWIRFGAGSGASAVIGHQPPNGEVITIKITECEGMVDYEAGARFALEYVGTPDEAMIQLALDEVVSTGANPPTMEELRMLARYPGLHDGNAVYLADFNALLRRHVRNVEFLSVWNEQIEEEVRGPNVLNINKLFISFSILGQTAAASQEQIRRIVARADDSYGITFVARREIQIPITITATVAAVHDVTDVTAQIRLAVLSIYGRGSLAASQGLQKTFRVQRLQEVLRAQVPALQGDVGDFRISIGATVAPLPEDFRFISEASLTITVSRLESSTGLWSI